MTNEQLREKWQQEVDSGNIDSLSDSADYWLEKITQVRVDERKKVVEKLKASGEEAVIGKLWYVHNGDFDKVLSSLTT